MFVDAACCPFTRPAALRNDDLNVSVATEDKRVTANETETSQTAKEEVLRRAKTWMVIATALASRVWYIYRPREARSEKSETRIVNPPRENHKPQTTKRGPRAKNCEQRTANSEAWRVRQTNTSTNTNTNT